MGMAPRNDECVNATVIPAAFPSPYVNVVPNASFATFNSMDPISRCVPANDPTVWYNWTPSASGRFDFFFSNAPRMIFPYLAIYAGRCGSLTEVACNSYFDGDYLRFTARAGVSYLIEVGFYISTPPGSVTLTVQAVPPPPPNDECVNATVIPSGSVHYTDFVNTTLATNNPADLDLSRFGANDPPGNGHTVWYTWTAARNGKIVVSNGGSTDGYGHPLATVFNIVTGACGAVVREACADSRLGTELSFLVAAGVTYYIEVGEERNGGGGGNLVLTFDFAASYFRLINADTDGPLGLLGSTVDYGRLNSSSLSIRSVFASDVPPIDSVRLTFDNPARSVCEENDPYTVFGNSGGDYFGAALPVGSHLVTATPYARSGCKGAAGQNISQAFRVDGCVFYVNVYNGTSDAYVTTLYDGNTVVPRPPCGDNIEAVLYCGFPVQRVALELRRTTAAGAIVASRVEVGEPYFLFGDSGRGDVYSGTIAAGNYSFSATYNGIRHPPITFTFGRCA